MAEERAKENEDRQVSEEDAVLNNEDQARRHYEKQNEDLDFAKSHFGEEYNEKFLAELEKIKNEKGVEYFVIILQRKLMGKDLEELGYQIHGLKHG